MIFGSSAPKFIYEPAGDAVEILLDYVVIQKDEPQEDFIIHQSVFTGHREFILKGKYWIIEMKMHLFKLLEATDYATVMEYYSKLKNYQGAEVRYYRHRDGDYLKDKNGNEVKMFLESVNESYYDTTDFKDLLYLKFKSTKYVDLARSVL